MSKVTKIFVEQKLVEKGLMKRIANAVDKLKAPSHGDQADQANHNNADGESATQKVLGRIFSTPSDSKRGILFLNDADLKDRYLTAKGEEKLVNAFSDDDLKLIFPSLSNVRVEPSADPTNPPSPAPTNESVAPSPNSFFKVLTNDFDLNDVTPAIVSKRPYAVLFNIPNNVAQSLTRPPKNAASARKALAVAISHKFYVATINASAIKKANLGALEDRDEREEKFNIKKFVTAYPIRAVIDAAREEQSERDGNKKLTPTDNDQEPDTDDSESPQLVPADIGQAKQIAREARRIFFRAAARGAWPTSSEDLKNLREELIDALTSDVISRDKKHLIPIIVKFFYTNQVKQDRHYSDLVKLLKADSNFMNLVNQQDNQPDETSDEEDSNVDDSVDEPTDEPQADKTPDELAAEIKAKGDDYADEVAKILARANNPAPAPSVSDIPDEIKPEVERLTKIKNNAINPKQREKAAADLARLLHQQEEKKKRRTR